MSDDAHSRDSVVHGPPEAYPTGALRWSLPPAPPQHGTPDSFHVLLRWTDELDDERAITLWAGLSAVEEPTAREAALLRWIDWAGVTVPLGVKLRDLVSAVVMLTRELEATVHSPERVYVYQHEDLAPMTRALQGWMRAREAQPGVVLGALQALALAREALRAYPERVRKKPSVHPPSTPRADFEVIPDVPDRERVSSREVARAITSAPPGDPLGAAPAMLAASVRRRIERGPIDEAAELLTAWLYSEGLPELPTWAGPAVEFALLVGELRGVHMRPLAQLASRAPAVWSEVLARGTTARDALGSVRLLSALSSHPQVARELSPSIADATQEALATALAHPRAVVWSRAARAIGRLAGYLPGLSSRLVEMLASGSAMQRLRAAAALGTLSPAAGAELLAQRAAVLRALDPKAGQAAEPSLVTAMAVGLPDLALIPRSGWEELARRVTLRGGPDAWLALARALQEVRMRDPDAHEAVESLAHTLRERAELWRGAAVDTERVERAVAIAARLAAPDESSPLGLVADLARAVAGAPASPELRRHVETFAAEVDVLVTGSSRAVGNDNARVAARGGVVLEELVDLLVEGDLQVIIARVVDASAHAAAAETAEALRTRLMKMVWTGLRRPTPATFAWRRWMLRAAASLPRVVPPGRRQHEVEREQVFETIERLAEDPQFGHPGLLRYTTAAVVDLSQTLAPALGESAPVAILVWLAVRGALQPAHGRLRRWMADDVPAEPLQRLFDVLESSERAHRDVAQDVASLGVLAGGEACRMGLMLTSLAAECVDLAQRRPESHWSGLPRFDLTDLANLADTLRRVCDDATFALTIDGERPPSQSPHMLGHAQHAQAQQALSEKAGRVNRMLTSTSLKFMDSARRVEVVEHYLSELAGLSESIASACGPLLETGLRGMLAKALVTVRAMAHAAVREREEGVRYIGRLRVLGELSSAHEGGMTSTYLAEGTAPGKKLVVKLLPWERFRGTSAELARAMFEGEMERLGGVVHPNIVSIMDAGFVDEGAYIALEYIPGASLETLLHRLGRVELRALGPIVRDMARALGWLHGRKIIHRDIKPGNVIVQVDLPGDARVDAKNWHAAEVVRAVLIDFGVATDVTRAGTHEGVTGTPGYIAPEIARGLNLFGPAVDVYAMGVMIFEMLTGTNPFLEGHPELNAVLVRHGSMTLPWQRLPAEAAKPELVQLLADSTRLDPRLRPSMKDFLTRWSKSLGLAP